MTIFIEWFSLFSLMKLIGPYARFQEKLKGIYTDQSWIDRNMFIFNLLRCRNNYALAGSIASSIHKGKSDKSPGDIDIVADSISAARQLINQLENKLLSMDYAHWRVFVNSQNHYVPTNCKMHYRFQTNLWLPICIFVLREGHFKNWYTKEGYSIQYFKHVVSAKKEMEELRDNDMRAEITIGSLPSPIGSAQKKTVAKSEEDDIPF